MEVRRQIDSRDRFQMKDVCAEWTFSDKKVYMSNSVYFFEANGMVKVQLDSFEGTFIFDKNTLLSYPGFKIEFRLKENGKKETE